MINNESKKKIAGPRITNFDVFMFRLIQKMDDGKKQVLPKLAIKFAIYLVIKHKENRIPFGKTYRSISLEKLAKNFAKYFELEIPPTTSYMSKSLRALRENGLIHYEIIGKDKLKDSTRKVAIKLLLQVNFKSDELKTK